MRSLCYGIPQKHEKGSLESLLKYVFYFGFLDAVHSFVRCLEQTGKVCRYGTIGNIQGGRTDADGYIIGFVTQFVKMLQILFDPGEKAFRGIGRIPREDTVEFIPAETAADIVLFCGVSDRLSDGLQCKITGAMSETVIDCLQFVQIQHQGMEIGEVLPPSKSSCR